MPSIAPQTGVGAVHIRVTDGPRSIQFYRDYVGLSEIDRSDRQVSMGIKGVPLVVLHPGASTGVAGNRTGLYHMALVVPSKRDLATAVARLHRLGWPQYPTDHVLTKANYLWDPDGNGIEIYTESPEDGTWQFSEDDFFAIDNMGRRRSGRDPINLSELFQHLQDEEQTQQSLPDGTKMGHVHLHVSDVSASLEFYEGVLGFDLMGKMSSAAFVSAGGYHHHIGINIWAGHGAAPPPPQASGLRKFTIEVPSQTDLDDVLKRLDHAELQVKEEFGNEFTIQDPSENQILLVVRTA